ncbi:GSCOCG00011972001-RA-CDS, partial [Cotesia congregata]
MRTFREEISVTPFQMATSEIRRTDRRGVNPRHLLYMAAKNMRLRVVSSLTVAFKFISNDTKVTKQQ